MMKRLWLALAASSALTACQAQTPDADALAAGERSDWMRPPSIMTVTRQGGALIVSGQAAAGARVVLRGQGGAAFAAAADPEGRFVVRVAETAGELILTPEVQNGQDAAAAPDRLVVLGSGPVALLRVGGPTRRLDTPVGGLDVVDSDGRALLASGRAPAGQEVAVAADGQGLRTTADADGRWSLMLPPGARSINVGDVDYVLPPWTGEGAVLVGQGWRVTWRTPDGALQRSWLPLG